MKRMFVALSAVSIACATSSGNTTGSGSTARTGSGADAAMASPEAKLRADMRKLWEEHVTYTGLFAIAAINGGLDANKIAERLLRNQDDIGNAIKPYYGDAAGNKLGSLLRDHILIAADLVKAAKAGDSAAQEAANKKWFQNADDIAGFLSSANPNWPQKTLQDMLHTHLQGVTDQVVALLKHDDASLITAYDKNVEHMMMLADALASGIAKQFPDKFRSS
ncbi:MAG: hypothetical protein ACJ79O_16415 [Myxococcales bacterium]